jgi:hypothetical protein
MIVKHGKAEIIDIVKDDEHAIDDEGTHKVLANAKEKVEKQADLKDEPNKSEK